MIDLRKLKIGTKLYSPLFGEVIVKAINDNPVFCIETEIQKVNGITNMHNATFTKEGKYLDPHVYPNTECMLFPSKEIRSWEDYEFNGIKDKDLIWCWGNSQTHAKELRFYDLKNKKTFCPNGERNGLNFANYEPYVGEYPEWAKEAQKTLED